MMGMTPDDVGRMTPWTFLACLDGFARSKGWKKGGGSAAETLSDDDLAAMGIVGF